VIDTIRRMASGSSTPNTGLRTSRPFSLLPLVLLAVMLALGLVIEAVQYDILLWKTKVPLGVLLAFALLKKGSSRVG
jgi:hypothetical protein